MMMLLLGLGDDDDGLLPLDLLALALLHAIIRDLLFSPPPQLSASSYFLIMEKLKRV